MAPIRPTAKGTPLNLKPDPRGPVLGGVASPPPQDDGEGDFIPRSGNEQPAIAQLLDQGEASPLSPETLVPVEVDVDLESCAIMDLGNVQRVVGLDPDGESVVLPLRGALAPGGLISHGGRVYRVVSLAQAPEPEAPDVQP